MYTYTSISSLKLFYYYLFLKNGVHGLFKGAEVGKIEGTTKSSP
jgi:hypothetical protein